MSVCVCVCAHCKPVHGTPEYLQVCVCRAGLCAQGYMGVHVFCAGCVCSMCECVSLPCLPKGRSQVRVCVYLHRTLCMHVWPGLGAGSGFCAGEGGQAAGQTRLRKSTHKDLVGWAFLPASLPRLKPQQLGPSLHRSAKKKGLWKCDHCVLAPPALQDRCQPCAGTS